MPTYRHPRAAADEPGRPPAAVHVTRAHNAAVDDDGVFEAPVRVGQAIAADFDTTEEAMRVEAAETDAEGEEQNVGETSDGDDGDETATDGGTCEVVKGDGEVCGRDLPCQYHSEA